MPFYVYVLVSERTGRTYVGVATNPERRLRQHNGHVKGGAKSTRAGRPWKQARLLGPYRGRGEAQQIEAQVKRARGLSRLKVEV